MESGNYRAGVALVPDLGGERIENYPERLVEYWPSTPLHYENGNSKNDGHPPSLHRGLVRILKKIRNEDGKRRLLISEGDSGLPAWNV